jgi:pilus assembly protein CpaC
VTTEIELEDGQSFAIGGLLDNRDTEAYNKVPGLGDIPFFGKLFRSRQLTRNNTELLVMVTPELVRPIPKGQTPPSLKMPGTFLEPNTSSTPPQHPGMDVTGPVPPKAPPQPTIPVEDLIKSMQTSQAQPGAAAPQLQFVPAVLAPPQGTAPPQTPSAAPAPATPPAATPPANPGNPR